MSYNGPRTFYRKQTTRFVEAKQQAALAKTIEKELGRENTLLLVGRCTISYKGRASSYAAEATRLIVIKPKGVVLVHGKTGHRPVNWQNTSKVSLEATDGRLTIVAARPRPPETIRIEFATAPVIQVAHIEDGDFKLIGSEADMVRQVMATPELVPGLNPPLQTEFSTPHGKIDLYGTQASGDPFVLEFKRSKAGLDAVSQLKRYVEYVRQTTARPVKGGLVAPAITKSAARLVADNGFEFYKFEASP